MPKPLVSSFDDLIQKAFDASSDYKGVMSATEFASSDRKKLLAMPFYMTKRKEKPEPKRGTWQYELFREITGKHWNFYDLLEFDDEKKITEFDYEEFLPKEVIARFDTNSEEFKRYVRKMNLETKTKYESFQEQREWFRGIMEMIQLGDLNEHEARSYLHYLENSKQGEQFRDEQKNINQRHKRLLE